MAALTSDNLSLAPLGAGDLIDRSVRIYRSHFMVMIRIAAPPVVVAALGSALWTLGVRHVQKTTSGNSLAFYFALAATGALLIVGSNLLYLIVMGGAARNLVAHILSNEPVSMRATYRNVRARFWSLLGATVLVALAVAFAAIVAFFAWMMAFWVVALVTGLLTLIAPIWLAALVGVTMSVAVTLGALWLFFWLAGRVAYVPQALLVEGKGVFASINRSAQLAHHSNARRLAALVFFSLFAAYAALALLAVPLGWYAYLNNLNLLPFGGGDRPVWYEISYHAIVQASTMLLAPVLITGLSLLYVDERVRNEAYDVELMAINRLGPMPKLKDGRAVPFAPALSKLER